MYYLKLVAASSAEAKLGALFLNAEQAKIFEITLEELSYLQLPTSMHINNSTTVGTDNSIMK